MDADRDARVVAAIDFGTTFSGVAYAHASDTEKVFSFYDWPCQARAGARPYCKTQTSLFYATDGEGRLQLKEWGWPALLSFSKAINDLKMQGKKGNNGVTALATRINAVSMGDAHSSKDCSVGSGSSDVAPQIVNHVVEVSPNDENSEPSEVLYFVSNFKLYLANDVSNQSNPSSKLPGNLTVEKLIIDYLSCISNFIVDLLKTKYGKHFTKECVMWCVTVPAIWNDPAKQYMKICAEKAGLVRGPQCTANDASPHPLVIVLEPEAASLYCLQRVKDLQLKKGDRILVADVGGGTIDLVVHSKATDEPGSIQVHEEVSSYGSLGGGTFVDQNFVEFISEKIGCFRDFCAEHPAAALDMLSWWEGIKAGFDGSGYTAVKELPRKLSDAWEEHDRREGKPAEEDYSEVRLEDGEMRRIFDGEVNKVLGLIGKELGGTKVLMVVGGFAGSPYLRKAINDSFKGKVGEIIIPDDPGSAVSQGAVTLGLHKHAVLTRVAKKTYGLRICTDARPDDPLAYTFTNHLGRPTCRNVFQSFVSLGQRIRVDDHVTKRYRPAHRAQCSMAIELFSSPLAAPRYTTEKESVLEGCFVVDIGEPDAGVDSPAGRWIEVTMHFGRSSIELTAVRGNFGCTDVVEKMLPVTFQS